MLPGSAGAASIDSGVTFTVRLANQPENRHLPMASNVRVDHRAIVAAMAIIASMALPALLQNPRSVLSSQWRGVPHGASRRRAWYAVASGKFRDRANRAGVEEWRQAENPSMPYRGCPRHHRERSARRPRLAACAIIRLVPLRIRGPTLAMIVSQSEERVRIPWDRFNPERARADNAAARDDASTIAE